MTSKTRDLLIGNPRKVGEPVVDLQGRELAYVVAVEKANALRTDPPIWIGQTTHPDRYLRDLRRTKNSTAGKIVRDLEATGVSVRVRLLHEVRIEPGAKTSPELKAYTKMWKAQKETPDE